MGFDNGDVVFEPLVAYEAVTEPSFFSVSIPSFAIAAIWALPTKLNSSLLHRARDKGTSNLHSALSLTAIAAALTLAMVARTEPT